MAVTGNITLCFLTEGLLSLEELELVRVERNKIKEYTIRQLHDITTEEQLEWFSTIQNKHDQCWFGVFLDSILIGTVSLTHLDIINLKASCGILIFEKFRRYNYGSVALKLLFSFAFKVMRLHSIIVEILSVNLPSICFFKSLGFTYIGCTMRAYSSNSGYSDVYLYSLLGCEYLKS